MMKKNRMYNYELLRIIAMIMIILLHTLSYGGLEKAIKLMNLDIL